VQRRAFLAGISTAVMGASCSEPSFGRQRTINAHPVTVNIDADRRLATIPPDFLGLGLEISSVAVPGLLSADNHTYVQLVRTLSTRGLIRVGGNTSDDATFARSKEAVSAPKGTVVNESTLLQLGTFLQATNWQLIWGLNLGSTHRQEAIEEAEVVSRAAKASLLAFEIGNEPDLFGRGTAHRPQRLQLRRLPQRIPELQSCYRCEAPHSRVLPDRT
jgi:hypothetical protein